ncbi:hypothetical protein [Streptomyces albogriseolus]|uniref:hypothetical protein n=1 Tax=Streptomyces albogriseolus TaxID=1887 RepID=UPI0036D17BC8
MGFAVLISAAIDGAGIHAGYRASTYAKTQYSGFKSKVLAYGIVITSAGLNANHAWMLGYGIPGAILFAAPAALLGFMLDSELGWMDKEEKQKQGHILERLPIFGRLAWVLFPGNTFRGLKTVVKSRLDSAVSGFEKRQGTTEAIAVKDDKETSSHDIKAIDLVPEVIEAKRHDKPKHDTTKPVADDTTTNATGDKRHDREDTTSDSTTELDDIFSELDKTTRLSELVTVALDKGFNDRDELHKATERHLGTEVKRSTLNTCIQRYNKKNAQVGMYL